MRRFCFLFELFGNYISLLEMFSLESGRFIFNFKRSDSADFQIIVCDCKDILEGKLAVHRGLSAQIELSSRNIDEALEIAVNQVNFLYIMLCFLHNVPFTEPVLRMGYETTIEADSTEFLQIEHFHLGDLLIEKRNVDEGQLGKLGNVFFTIDEPRILRAIRWYQKGFRAEDLIDRFICFWFGLESLNKLFMDYFGVDSEYEECKICKVRTKKPSSIGIKTFFMKYGENSNDYKKCNKLRAELVHGFGSLVESNKNAIECAEICRKMLRKGLLLLIGRLDDIAGFDPAPIYNFHSPRLEFRGKYQIPPRDLTTLPYLIVDSNNIKIIQSGNNRSIEFENSIDTNINSTVSFESITMITEANIRIEYLGHKLEPK